MHFFEGIFIPSNRPVRVRKSKNTKSISNITFTLLILQKVINYAIMYTRMTNNNEKETMA